MREKNTLKNRIDRLGMNVAALTEKYIYAKQSKIFSWQSTENVLKDFPVYTRLNTLNYLLQEKISRERQKCPQKTSEWSSAHLRVLVSTFSYSIKSFKIKKRLGAPIGFVLSLGTSHFKE